MSDPSDLFIDKPHAEIRALPLTDYSQQEIRNRMPRIRLYRSSPAALTLQVRVPKTKTLAFSSVNVTVDELREMLTYAEAQWPSSTDEG